MPSAIKSRAPPVIDFSPYYGTDGEAKTALIDQVKAACLDKGFFQIINHNVPESLRQSIMQQTKAAFDLDDDTKLKYNKANNTWNRGFEAMGTQILEEGTLPEVKEGFYIGRDLAEDHPAFVARRFNCGPNYYPPALGSKFKEITDAYYAAVFKLAREVLTVLALTLELEENYFTDFIDDAVGTIRLIHYPQTNKGTSDDVLRRGIGAHTDFGALTLLMQDTVSGLQVWDKEVEDWYDVVPLEGAYVVNLGNLMQRWTNDIYKSNLHRVINKSGLERYSIPFFLSGNLDYIVKCLPGCEGPDGPKYPPITVEEYVDSKYKESYGRAAKFAATTK